MTEERLERLEAVVERLSGTIDVLVTEFIRPATQQAYANYERLARLESALETLVGQSLVNAEQIASNTESITRLEAKVDDIAETVSEQSQQIQVLIEEGRADRQVQREAASDQSRQIQVLIEEGRADRQTQREALAAILSIGGRVDVLERRAS